MVFFGFLPAALLLYASSSGGELFFFAEDNMESMESMIDWIVRAGLQSLANKLKQICPHEYTCSAQKRRQDNF
jgi:hypothetical protein